MLRGEQGVASLFALLFKSLASSLLVQAWGFSGGGLLSFPLLQYLSVRAAELGFIFGRLSPGVLCPS